MGDVRPRRRAGGPPRPRLLRPRPPRLSAGWREAVAAETGLQGWDAWYMDDGQVLLPPAAAAPFLRGVDAALLQAKVNTDDLTGMLNRKGLDIAVTGWLTRRSPFGVLMLKIDPTPNAPDSKSSGDDDGAADELFVKSVSRLINEAMRDSDLVGRWAHDEFLVLCRDEDPKRILGFGNRMRVIVEEETVSTSIPLTVSEGVSLFPLFEHFDETVKRVTTARREAQAAAKNCVKAQWRTGVAL